MKSNKILGLIIGAVAACGLFIACDLNEESCLTDTDCPVGDVCEEEICIAECSGPGTCLEGQVCVLRADGEGSVCQDDPDFNNSNNVNNTNNFNNTNNVNNVGSDTYIAMIRDTSFSAESCDITDPGSDIMYVELKTDTGATLGYGSLVSDLTVGETNEYNFGLNLDGEPPSFGAACPDFNEDTVMALGCGGAIALEFWDTGGTPVSIELGNDIFVAEFGSQCSTGTVTDDYEVYLCGDTAGVKNNDDLSSCNVNLGGGSAELAVTVTSLP